MEVHSLAEPMDRSAAASIPVMPRRARGRPPKDVKLVRYAVLWLSPDVADALSAECGDTKRAAIVRECVIESLKARGRLPADYHPDPRPEAPLLADAS